MQFPPLGGFKGGSESSASEDPTGNIVCRPFLFKVQPNHGTGPTFG